MLTRDDILDRLAAWYRAWNDHDLDAVMELFHDDVEFENWTGGRAEGRAALRAAWAPWFADHGGFRFVEEETFVDAPAQKALYRWTLEWPSREPGYEGAPEVRRGVDVLHFDGGLVRRKLTYAKTTLRLDGRRVRLAPPSAGGPR
ncbi:MAG: YybH family protein [Deferrisomatales bacterium]